MVLQAAPGWQPVIPAGELYAFQRDRLHHSAAVRVGSQLIVSGVIGMDGPGKLVAEPAAQFARAFENLARLLEGAGTRLSDVAELLTFHVDFDRHIGAFVAAKDARFPASPYPAWTAIGVANLAFGALVEIRATAAPAQWQRTEAPR